MPIVTRTLESIQPTKGGVFASFLAVDDQGREWRRSRSRFVSEAAAQAALDTHDWGPQLESADFQDLLIWVRGLNTVADFDLTDRDITEEQGEDFIAGTFAESPGADAIHLAWWIESLSPPSWAAIFTRVGWTSQEGSRIQDRAIALLAAEPVFDAVEEIP